MTANSALITDYLGYGTHAARPAAPNIGTGVTAVYYETDTGNTFAWSGAAWVQLNAAGGAGTAPYSMAQGRLTLTTALPVTTSDVTAAGTLYWTPYHGDQIGLYDGASAWTVLAFAETSLSLTLTSGKPYDIFAYNNSGTLALESLVWTNDTTRATALVMQNGILVKSGATTRRYLGTIYASGTNTTEDSISKRYVWNYYNRALRSLRVIDTTDNWNYSTTAWQQANANAANKVNIIVGVSEDIVTAIVVGETSSAAGGIAGAVGVGIDSTTVNSAQTLHEMVGSSAPTGVATYRGYPGIGQHAINWIEYRRAGTVLFKGDDGVADCQTGLAAEVWC